MQPNWQAISPGFRRASQVALFICIVVITWLAFTANPPESATLGWDKANHSFAFLVLAGLSDFAFPRGDYRHWISLVGYGLFIEIGQWFLGYRFFELVDLVADTAGILIYCLIQPHLERISFIRVLKNMEPLT